MPFSCAPISTFVSEKLAAANFFLYSSCASLFKIKLKYKKVLNVLTSESLPFLLFLAFFVLIHFRIVQVVLVRGLLRPVAITVIGLDAVHDLVCILSLEVVTQGVFVNEVVNVQALPSVANSQVPIVESQLSQATQLDPKLVRLPLIVTQFL